MILRFLMEGYLTFILAALINITNVSLLRLMVKLRWDSDYQICASIVSISLVLISGSLPIIALIFLMNKFDNLGLSMIKNRADSLYENVNI